jgi:uncharacterized protein
MPHTDPGLIVLFTIALFAASVNGALGYGFSSLTVPVALLFFSNRILSPALVLVELGINSWIVFLNWGSLAGAWRRALPILLGLAPGVLLGSYLLSRLDPGWLKLFTYSAILPLILLQAAGFRRPVQSEATIAFPLGLGVGTLYATTTISGPPLALMFNNQGLDKNHFRGTLGIVRVAETTMTAVAYGWLGLYNSGSFHLLGSIVPAVLVGLPLGNLLITRVRVETFRRICMSFDAWVVGFGLARTLVKLNVLREHQAFAIWCGVILIDLCLLYRYFGATRTVVEAREYSTVTNH